MSDDERDLEQAIYVAITQFPLSINDCGRLHDALMPVIREALAQALNGVALELADCENDCAGLLAERADQWREQP